MQKLTSRLAMQAALVALLATGAVMLPGISAMSQAGLAGHAFAKDGDSGDSGSGSDGRGSDSGNDDGEDGDSDNSNSGSGKDDSDDDDSASEDDSSRGRESRERDEVTVSLSQDQIQSVLSGQSRLVDNLGRTLELEIETENGVSKVTAKPHGGDARRNPGPIGNVSVVLAIGGSTNDDGTPDQGQGDK
jgi:hypothetical protein